MTKQEQFLNICKIAFGDKVERYSDFSFDEAKNEFSFTTIEVLDHEAISKIQQIAATLKANHNYLIGLSAKGETMAIAFYPKKRTKQ